MDLTVHGLPCPLYYTRPVLTGLVQPSFPQTRAAGQLMNLERWQHCFRPPVTYWDTSHSQHWASNGSFFFHDDRPESALVIWQETNSLRGTKWDVEWNLLRVDLRIIFSLFTTNRQNAAEAQWRTKALVFNAQVACYLQPPRQTMCVLVQRSHFSMFSFLVAIWMQLN